MVIGFEDRVEEAISDFQTRYNISIMPTVTMVCNGFFAN